VLERLERIDELRRRAAPPRELLAELRALLRDGEAWAAAEGDQASGAKRQLGRLASALAEGQPRRREEPSEDGRQKGVVARDALV